MRKVLILIVSLYSLSVSLSAQDIPRTDLPREVKEWCLGVNDQNKELVKKLAVKDTTINLMKYRIKLLSEKDSVNNIIKAQKDSINSALKGIVVGKTAQAAIEKKKRIRNGIERDASIIVLILLIIASI